MDKIWIKKNEAILTYQRKMLEEQEEKFGKGLYIATDIKKEDINEINGS